MVEQKKDGGEEVVLVDDAKIKTKQAVKNPFLSEIKTWDEEDWAIPAELKKGIREGLGFQNPSKI